MLQTGGVLRDLSVREIVAMMGALFPNPLPVDDVLAMAGLSDIADQRTQKLSGGQSQRVRFAVAMVSDPDLLVLDEPTVAMDVEARNAFWATMRAFASRGKTVIFATHYLEEADAYADRIILMARGRVVADGATTEIKSRVGGKTIRVTLPGVSTAELGALAGVAAVDTRGDAVLLHCNDSDQAIRALLAAYPAARDIEVTGAGLEQAFLALTGDDLEDEWTGTPGAGRIGGPAGLPGRHVLATAHHRHTPRHRRTAAVVLAHPGDPRRRGRPGLGGEGLDRRRGVDGRDGPAGHQCLPARHCPGVTSSD
jgi:ABC-2 type transport system ATP-binding protein